MTKISNIDEANKLLAEISPELIRLQMPIGDSDFRDIIKNKYIYVDKTLFAKEIIKSSEKVILITRPRRWGKTLGMSMLKSFLAMEVDKDGKELAQNSNRVLFRDLNIASSETINEQGKHPVIFICLKDAKADSYKETESNFRAIISDIYSQYEYIADAIENKPKKNTSDFKNLRLFKSIINQESSINELQSSLHRLMKLIETHHHKKTYLLIDEYDAPLNNAYNTEHYDQTLSLIKALFSITLKGNDYLRKAVITGVFKIAKSGLFSGLNNCKDYSILADKYAQYFGFTEEEVESLLVQANIYDQTIISAVREWYNGYHIGEFTIYNPWSIINFFSDLKIGPYWVNTESMVTGESRLSTDIMITEEIHDRVNLLISNFGKELTEIAVNPEVVFSILNQEPESLWGLLLFGGYLSVESSSYDQDGSLVCQAKIPNEEVLFIYHSSIYLWVKGRLSLDKISFDSLGKDFNLEDADNVKRTIDNALAIYGNRIAQQNESIFHGLIQSICLFKGDKHHIASESFSGSGRVDSIFYPVKGKSDSVIIHEYKIIKDASEQKLAIALRRAMWQMYEKIYSANSLFKKDFLNYDFKNIEIRAIIIICDHNHSNVQIISKHHSISQMKEIVAYFTLDEKNQITEDISTEINNEITNLLHKRRVRNELRGEI
jgi:hypothetical protein